MIFDFVLNQHCRFLQLQPFNETDQAETSVESDDDDDEDDDTEADCASDAVSHKNALDYVNQLLKWCDQNQSTKYVSGLLDLRKDIIDGLKEPPKKQTLLSDYFTKQT